MKGVFRLFLTLVITLPLGGAFGQYVQGVVTDARGDGIPRATVKVSGWNVGVVTDSTGKFDLDLSSVDKRDVVLRVSHVSFALREIRIDPSEVKYLEIMLQEQSKVLDGVAIIEKLESDRASTYRIDPLQITTLPNPNRDFTSILKLLPGVVANSELSASYSVRGGNYDENLVFINDMPVYRPFLITNGQQEGLSAVIPEFARTVAFSTGGWSARYGGKMSSLLRINYRRARKREWNASAGLMGGQLQGGMSGDKWSTLFSVRFKSSQYLLNTLETGGAYRPRFFDMQQVAEWRPSSNTSLQWLIHYGRNRYFVRPESRTTDFGTFNSSLRLFVAFDGSEQLNYDTWQTAFNVKQVLSSRWSTQLVVSGVVSREQEFTNVEGGYRLCDVDRDPGSDTFNDCLTLRGVGSNFRYGRNELDALMLDLRNDHEIELREGVELLWGLQLQLTDFEDQLNEYSFVDSADYITSLSAVNSQNQLSQVVSAAYISLLNSNFLGGQAGIGLRAQSSNLHGNIYLAPRLFYNRTVFLADKALEMRLSAGTHVQPPFFREFRTADGSLLTDIAPQVSHTFMAGATRNMELWGRGFQWVNEIYYRFLSNLIPYEVDNVRIRYLPDRRSTGYAYGLDSRFGGEFITGTESWFSLSILKTAEDIEGDERGYIRRPSDQRVTAGLFFQDHFPNNPDMRVTLNMQFGSGLPFGPPGDLSRRSLFTGSVYKRVDTGFSYDRRQGSHLWRFGLEILNMLGTENPITYTWIQDVSNQRIAVPNGLTGRFFNLRVSYFFI